VVIWIEEIGVVDELAGMTVFRSWFKVGLWKKS